LAPPFQRWACRLKIWSSTYPRYFQLCCTYCESWCMPWIWKCRYCISIHQWQESM